VQEKRIHQIFVISVLAKGAHALIEITGGIALYLFSASAIAGWLDEIDKGGWLERHFPASDQHFYAFYLLSHGLVKSALVAGLLRERLWAYPASIAVFGGFIAYQLYRYSWTHDVGLIALSVFDLFVIYLAVHEYRLLRKHLPTH
jgi:uncharacterized membrane protein